MACMSVAQSGHFRAWLEVKTFPPFETGAISGESSIPACTGFLHRHPHRKRLPGRLLLDRKFLDAVVIGVDDVQVAVAVEGDAVRGVELPRLGPLPAEAAQILAVLCELLDAPADGTYP